MVQRYLIKKLSLIALFTLVCISTLANEISEWKVNGVYYLLLSDNTCMIVGCDEETVGDIVIPSSVVFNGNSFSVTSIRAYAFDSCKSLTSISIPNSVTNIYEAAFAHCHSLKYVNIPDYVTEIAMNSFEDCLATFVIPNGVTNIDDGAFKCCVSLTSIDIPNSVTSMGREVFKGCTSLRVIKIPNSVTSIESETFEQCESLTAVDIPHGVTYIGDGVFRWCDSLTTVNIGNSVTSIGYEAFEGCGNLIKIFIPNSVKFIDHGAFQFCKSLVTVHLGDSVKSIGDSAFERCGLTSIDIPNSVTTIGEGAFKDNGFNSISIGNGVSSIGATAFNYGDTIKIGNNCAMKYLIRYREDFVNTSNQFSCSMLIISVDYSDTEISTITEHDYGNDSDYYDYFYINSNWRKIISETANPMALDASGISDDQYKNIEVIVPTKSLADYQAADVWKNFWNIKGGAENYSTTGIGNVTIDKVTTENVIYDLQGRRLRAPQHGLNIINGKKVLVK